MSGYFYALTLSIVRQQLIVQKNQGDFESMMDGTADMVQVKEKATALDADEVRSTVMSLQIDLDLCIVGSFIFALLLSNPFVTYLDGRRGFKVRFQGVEYWQGGNREGSEELG
jgi:hypothetical protein